MTPLTPTLSITPAALAQLESEIKPAKVEQVLPYLAGSVASFIGSVYFKRSAWFRDQPRHTIEAVSVTLDGREVRPVLVLEQGVLGTLAEMPVAEDYYDQRLLEETRVDYF